MRECQMINAKCPMTRGFTLVELLVVISLFFVTATTGLVAFNRFSASQVLNTSASEMVSYLVGVRSQAVSQEMLGSCTSQLVQYSVRFVLPDTYELWVYCNGSSYQLGRKRLPNGVVFVSGTSGEIGFSVSTGISTGGIVRLSGGGSTKVIQVSSDGNVTG